MSFVDACRVRVRCNFSALWFLLYGSPCLGFLFSVACILKVWSKHVVERLPHVYVGRNYRNAVEYRNELLTPIFASSLTS